MKKNTTFIFIEFNAIYGEVVRKIFGIFFIL